MSDIKISSGLSGKRSTKRRAMSRSFRRRTKPLSTRVKKLEKEIAKGEVKYHANQQVLQPVGVTAAVYPLTNIVEGDAFNEREGNKIAMKSMIARLSAVQNAAATETFLRVIVVIDKDNNGTPPVNSDILEQNANYLSPLSHVNGRRFKVIYDDMLSMTVGFGSCFTKISKKLSQVVRFDGVNAVDTREGSMWLVLCSNQPVGSPPLVDFYFRVRFTDS